MNPYASFQLPDLARPFLQEPETATAVRRYWLNGCDRLHQSWLRSARKLFAHYDVLLREGQSLQNSVLAQYLEWTKEWTGASTIGKVPEAGEPEEKGSGAPSPVAAKAAAAPAKTPAKDDLTRLRGVGKVVQQRLYDAGVVSYRQIAKWTAKDIARIENDVLGGRFAGRISRDQWPSQAKEFLKKA